MATTKKKKDSCAVKIGRKGGLATKRKKVGIFSDKYKKKTAKKKKATRKKATSKKKK